MSVIKNCLDIALKVMGDFEKSIINFQFMMLEKNSTFKMLLYVITILGLSSCKAQNTKENAQINLREAYFGNHFMIDLDSLDIAFDTTLVPRFEKLGEDKDWANTETSTGENVLELYNKVTNYGKLREPNFSYSAVVDSVSNENIYQCRCSKGYFWKEYAIIYCEIVKSKKEKFTQNLIIQNDSLIFSQDSGELLIID